MLTPEQEKWINSLSDRQVVIVPYDDRSERLFNEVKKEIHNLLGPEVKVEHVGASSLGISGQNEIDVSIVINKDKFDEYISKLETVFGPVKAKYVDRVRFEEKKEGKKIDLKLIDVDHSNYKKSKVFENYLKNNPEELERYKLIKEESNGQTVKEYYRRKTEFINEVLLKVKS